MVGTISGSLLRCFLLCTVVLSVLIMATGPVEAEPVKGKRQVVEEYIKIAGSKINSTNVSALAAAASSTNSAEIYVGDTEAHSISYKYVAANAGASFTLTVQHKTKWGDWVGFATAVTATCAGASGNGTKTLTLPACEYIRVVQSSDASYATTLAACTINAY